MTVLWTIMGCAIAAIALTALAIVALGAKLLGPGQRRITNIHALGPEQVELDANDQTTHDGVFGLWYNDGQDHALVGDVIAHTGNRVQRRVLDGGGRRVTTSKGWWTGHVYPSTAAIDPAAAEVTIPTELGPAPAWVFHPDTGPADTWTIHIHGLRTTRITALRGVPATLVAGTTALVPSFRGDSEGPAVFPTRATLGEAEWRDIDAAIGWALSQGAKQVVLVGWSMGGTIALFTAERSPHRDKISSLILVAPVTDWRSVIKHNITRAHLPAIASPLLERALESRTLSRLIGLQAPLNLDELSWNHNARLQVPTLVIHSPGDNEVPFALTQQFIAANPAQVKLATFPAAAHTWEYNIDRERFDAAVNDWLTRG